MTPARGLHRAHGSGPIVFRPPRSAWWVLGGAFVVVLGFTIVAFVSGLGIVYRVGLVVFCSLFPVAFVELAMTHLTLAADTLTFVKSFRHRVIARQEIASVTWSKGGGVSLKLVSGRWVRLPSVGDVSSQGLTHSVRAWLKRTGDR